MHNFKLEISEHLSLTTAPGQRTYMQALAAMCCPFGSSSIPIVEMTSFADKDSAVMSNGEDGPSLAQQAAQQAKGLMGKIAAPIKELEKERARDKKLDELKAGAMMQLLPDGKQRQSLTVKVAVSPDGAMVTWAGTGVSGVMALAAIREVKPIMKSGIVFVSEPTIIPNQFKLIAEDQAVGFEAKDEEVKEKWISTLQECSVAAAQAKVGRNTMQKQVKREMGLEERRRANERRKAEIIKGAGGMKHTAAAKMNRGGAKEEEY